MTAQGERPFDWRRPDPTLPLQVAEVRVLDAMWTHASPSGLVAVGTRNLGILSGAGRYSTVRYALRALAERGAIEHVERGSEGRPSVWRVRRSVDEVAAQVGVHGLVVL